MEKEVFLVENAGLKEVNGPYALARKIHNIPEYWYIRTTEHRKQIIETIYKIRGGISLPQFGYEFNNSWILYYTNTEGFSIQYYAAPMDLNNDLPPSKGWIPIGGISPSPIISSINIDLCRKQFDDISSQLEEAKQEVTTIKNEGADKNDPKLKKSIEKLTKLKEQYKNLEYILSCKQVVHDKSMNRLRTILDRTTIDNFIYSLSADIYGGVGGLYDYGPIGAAMKSNIIQEWKNHFIIYDDMLEVESCMLTPETVLIASGHVAKFADYMVKDKKTGVVYRVDKLIENKIDELITNTPNMNEDEKTKHLKVRNNLSEMDENQLIGVLDQYNITGEDNVKLEGPIPFNLMFSTPIGPTGGALGYLRPETAQGIFVNFNKLLKYNNNNMPFAAAQIGHAFRNEIAPRGGLLRVREFQMAEIEHFCDDQVDTTEHPKYYQIKDLKLRLLPKENQENGLNNIIEISIDEAINKKMISNTTLAYYLGRTFLFMKKIGINLNNIRFRQHKSKEMAHYAKDCWDCELYTSYGWIECVGHADRACYDLKQHAKMSNIKLHAEKVYKEPQNIIKIIKKPHKINIGKKYKKESKIIIDYLTNLNDDEAKLLKNQLNNNNNITINIKNNNDNNNNNDDNKDNNNNNTNSYIIDNNMFDIEERNEKIYTYNYIPSVVEPSFGIGRILYSLLEHSLWDRIEDENRIVLSLKPRISPIKVLVVPLSNKDELIKLSNKLHNLLKEYNVYSKIDESSANIGKKYSRSDEIGIPFAVTIDFQSIKDNTITIRERDTTKPQIRLLLNDAPKLLADLSKEEIKWSDALNKYPHHMMQEI